MAEEEDLVPLFTNWLMTFEAKKMSYATNPEEMKRRSEEEEPKEFHPGIEFEEEVRWEIGLGMEPRRGEDEESEGEENSEEAMEVDGGGGEEIGVGQKPKRMKKREPKKKLDHYETIVYAHCGGR